MANGHTTTYFDRYWTDLFQSLSCPFALLKINPNGSVKLQHSNTAFQQLFKLKVTRRSNGQKQLPPDFVKQLQQPRGGEMTTLWRCELDQRVRFFNLQWNLVPDPDSVIYLLIMQDVSDQEIALQRLRHQNDELQQRLADIERLKNRIREQSIRDPLTNLFNRRFLNEFMERELALARRNQKPLALVMLDLDHFKQLNDQYGHQTGDKVIEMVAKHLLRQSRRTDILFRYGGEEFLVILPNTTAVQAKHLAENWRVHVQQASVRAKHQEVSITLSAGIACYPEHGTTAFNLIQAADEALYQAKAAGRNQVVMG